MLSLRQLFSTDVFIISTGCAMAPEGMSCMRRECFGRLYLIVVLGKRGSRVMTARRARIPQVRLNAVTFYIAKNLQDKVKNIIKAQKR
jgi:hypothetical protein